MKIEIVKNMGLRWTIYRTQYEVKKKLGYLEKTYPTKSIHDIDLGINIDRAILKHYLREGLNQLSLNYTYNNEEKSSLLVRADNILVSRFYYFDNEIHQFKGWNYSPKTGIFAPDNIHWSKISDFQSSFGDIKWIWELNRFTFAYDLVRAYLCTEQKNYVEKFWELFESFAKNNPLEMGVNYKCSQEMSFRINAWLFALFHFIDHPASSERRVELMLKFIAHHLEHIHKHINFSVEAVKNNHSISEATTLIVASNTLKFLPRSRKYYKRGIKFLQKEINWQIKEDGTFIQHSHNYHRLVLQNLSWYLVSAISLNQKVPEVIKDKAQMSIDYFLNIISEKGQVPNYGMNDGSYIMPLTEKAYDDYRPVLQCLNYQLHQDLLFEDESINELPSLLNRDFERQKLSYSKKRERDFVLNNQGGYHVVKYGGFRVFVKSKTYKERPVQADMNHVDIWYGDKCIFTDAGTYSYNDSDEILNYFNGTFSHNTVLINDENQMIKGSRFIWFNWSKSKKPKVYRNADSIEITIELINYGEYSHQRHIIISDDQITVHDKIKNRKKLDTDFKLQWLTELDSLKVKDKNVSLENSNLHLEITSEIDGEITIYNGESNPFRGWVSSTYGEKHPANQIVFQGKSNKHIIEMKSILTKI